MPEVNPLRIGNPTDPMHPLTDPGPDWGSAFSSTSAAVINWLTRQRQKSIDEGLLDPSGWPTTEGWKDALTQWAGTLQGGLKVHTPGGRIARVDIRGLRNVLKDAKPKTAAAIGDILDAHIAHGDVPLAGDPADVTVTLPPGIRNAADIADRSRDMVSRATLMTQDVPSGMTPPRYWYSEGADALHGVTGQELDATQRLAASHAVTSPQADVFGNSNLAVNAWNQSQFGNPLQVRTGAQNAALEEVLYGNELPESRKVGPFFENHMRYLDPSWGKKITNDIWQMRDAGFSNADATPYSGTPTVGEDNYVRMMVDRATRQLNSANVDGGNWTPDQVQAALWTHAKTEQETGTPSSASVNFKNALERLQTTQANAHRPGPALIANSAEHVAFQKEARPHLVDRHGRDTVSSSLGMLTPPNVPGGGIVSITADGIKQSSRDLMDAGTLIRATLLRHPDAFWAAHADVKGVPTIDNSNVVHALSGSPEHYVMQVRQALDRAGGGLEGAIIQHTPAGPRIINVNERTGLDNRTFQSAVKDAIKQSGLKTSDLVRARADYGYFTHDWERDPTGAGYVAQLARLPANLQRAGDQLFAQLGGGIDAAASRVSGGQGNTGPWRVPGFAEAVGPEVELPQRPWIARPSPSDPGSQLPNLLGLR